MWWTWMMLAGCGDEAEDSAQAGSSAAWEMVRQTPDCAGSEQTRIFVDPPAAGAVLAVKRQCRETGDTSWPGTWECLEENVDSTEDGALPIDCPASGSTYHDELLWLVPDAAAGIEMLTTRPCDGQDGEQVFVDPPAVDAQLVSQRWCQSTSSPDWPEDKVCNTSSRMETTEDQVAAVNCSELEGGYLEQVWLLPAGGAR